MKYEEEVKQERSIPVQGRVNLVDLANLDKYFMSQGQEIRTMSQLLNWGIGLVVEVLDRNSVLEGKLDNLSDAGGYLESRRLYQPGIRKRGVKKYANALTFENLREHGEHPEDYVSRQHKVLHNKGSIKPYANEEAKPVISTDEVNMVNKMVGVIRKKKAATKSKLDTSNTVFKGDMTAEELAKYNSDREEEVIAKENAPIDMEGMKFAEE